MSQKWKVVLAFAGVFVAGVIFGGTLGSRWIHFERLQKRPPLNERILLRFESELDLTPEQVEKLRPIAKRMEAETHRMRREAAINYRNAMDAFSQEIGVNLNPKQRQKYNEMRQAFREKMERREREGFRLPD
jgi:hypothetical protein